MGYNYLEELRKLGINETDNGKYICPACQKTERENKNDKSLSLTFNEDGVLGKCHYINCEYSKGFFIPYTKNEHDNFRPKNNNISHKIVPVSKPSYEKPSVVDINLDYKKYLYNYFNKRGISNEIIDKYKVEINNNKEIAFQYFKNKELINVKYRTNLGGGKKTFRQEKNTEKIFYGIDEVGENVEEVVIVEGCPDVLALAEIGIPAISVPQGGSDTKLECINNCWDFLSRFKSYVIATDDDDVGKKLQKTLLQRLPKYKCKTVSWKNLKEMCPEFKGKDANDLLLYDKELLSILISEATYIPLENIYSTVLNEDNLSKILGFRNDKYKNNFSTGWEGLDEYLKIAFGKLMVVTGIAGRGKSFWVDNLLFNLTKKYQLKHLLFSFESTFEEHLSSFFEFYKQKSFAETLTTDFAKKILMECGLNYDGEFLIESLKDIEFINQNGLISNKILETNSYLEMPISYELDSAKKRVYNTLKFILNKNMSENDILESMNYFKDFIFKYECDDNMPKIDDILDIAEEAIYRYGINTITIDPYNNLTHDLNSFNGREDLYLQWMLTKVRNFAKKHNVLVIFIAHPRKEEFKTRIKLWDISGGATWANKCDYGIVIDRNKDDLSGINLDETQIFIDKVKTKTLGKQGLWCLYKENYTLIEEWDKKN